MSDDAIDKPQEIVIVRRRGGDDGAVTKGGAWKIAYADFVTAMMAFFLVMWLINASNEETRAQVASYFNPIKLTDSSTGSRGLKDQKSTKNTQKGENGESAGGTPPSASDVKKESALMANPDKLLAKIEEQLAAGRPQVSKPEVDGELELSVVRVDGSAPGVGDPFDPHAWEAVPPAPPAPQSIAAESAESDSGQTAESALQAPAGTPIPPVQPPDTVGHDVKSEPLPAGEETEAASREAPASVDAGKTSKAINAREFADKAAEQSVEAKSILTEIAKRLGTGLDDLPASVIVKTTDAGMLISLTDRQTPGMFKTGSAEPTPELVQLVEAIAGVIGGRPGYIVIRGHTDSRPYRNKTYDNWQLSTARAHLAHYMLVRGGLDESRIRRVEGLADRDPKNPGDPQAPENRRIEILLGRE